MTLANLLSKRIVFVTGKGGIGKSLYAAALGAYAASQGKKVCLVESSAEEQLAPLFGHKPVGHKVTPITDNLYVFNIEPQLNFRDFVVLHLGFETLFDRVFNHDIVRSFIRMIPGIAELTFLGRLYYLSELAPTQRMDLVIVDGFASGHFLSLMTTPDAILNSGLTGPIVTETKRVRDYMAKPENAAMILVTQPGALITTETEDFIAQFTKESPVNLQQIVLNKANGIEKQHLDANVSPELRVAWEKLCQSTSDTAEQLKVILRKTKGLPAELVALPDVGAFPEPVGAERLIAWLLRNKLLDLGGKP